MSKRSGSYYDGHWPRYETTRPIDVEAGIKAKSQRGKFVRNWWADRWIAALKPLMDSGRLGRGRTYARRGQVLNIDVAPGRVTSRVQGSRRAPYKVNIQLNPLRTKQWDKVLDALAEQAIFAAQLLNGEMPADIQAVFEAVNVPLFPTSRGDLETNCSCPDWANPCKHIAAVYYLLGEQFDEDPFLLFELRGRSQEEIAVALRERRAVEVKTVEAAPYMPDLVKSVDVPALEDSVDRYWTLGVEAADIRFSIAHPRVPSALLKRVGIPDFEGVNPRNFQRQMERVYDGVTVATIRLALADSME